MFLIYFMLFIAVNVTSCVHIPDEIYPKGTSTKSFSRKSLNANLGDSGSLLKLSPTDTSSDQSKVIKENYFPDVIYPTNILDVTQPFFYRVNAYDEVLGPFSEDVKSSYKFIISNTKATTSKNVTPNYDDEILKNVSQSQINYNLDKLVNIEEDIIKISKCNESHEKNLSEVSNEDNFYDMSIIEQEQQMNESEANSNLSFTPSPCTNETDLEVVEEITEDIYKKTTLLDKQECDSISIMDSKEYKYSVAYLNVDDEDSLKEKNKLKSENSETKVPIGVKISIEVFRNNHEKQINPIEDIDLVLGPGIIVDDSMNEEKNETLIEKGKILRNIDLIEQELKLFENEFATINKTFDYFNDTPSSSSIESFEREKITDDTLFSSIEKLSWTAVDSPIDLPIDLPSNISEYNASNYSASFSEDDSENNATNVYTVPLVIYLKSNTSISDNNNQTNITTINNSVQDEDFFLDLPSNISEYNASNDSASFSEDDSQNNATNVYTVPLVIYLKSNTSIDDSNNDTYIITINNTVQDEHFFLDLLSNISEYNASNDSASFSEDDSENNATNVYTVPLVIYSKSNASIDDNSNETYITIINNSAQDENFFLDLPPHITDYKASNYSVSFSEDDSENNATNVYTVPLVIYSKSNTSIDDSNNDTYITTINNSVQDEDFFLDFIISLDTLCETNDTTELQNVKNLTDLYVIENLRELLSEDNIRNITLFNVNANREDVY